MDDAEREVKPPVRNDWCDETICRPIIPIPGDLLVAGIGIDDEFDQAVILVLESDAQGSVGVVLNRSASWDLTALLPGWNTLVNPPAEFFDGGPVSPDGAICLARLSKGCDEPPGWRRVFRDIGLLSLDVPIELVQDRYADLRIFAGYAGWGPQQLQVEMAAGLWHVLPSTSEDIFGPTPEGMWRRVLHRALDDAAFFSTWTATPQFN